jgi:hypothetical protein
VKLLRAAIAILFGLVLGAALIYALLPAARAREDRHRLYETRGSCQVLLIGPSYAAMVVPKAFDEEARRIGLNKRLCMFGKQGMRGFELAQELDFALSQDWSKLEVVLIDITLEDAPSFHEANWFKSRTVEWHTLAGMKWLLEHYRANPQHSPELRVWIAHARHFLAHYASLGRAPEVVGWREPLKTWRTRQRDNAKRAAKKQRDRGAAEAKRDAKTAREKKRRPEPEPLRTKTAKAKDRKAKIAKSKSEPSQADPPKSETPNADPQSERKLRKHLSQVKKLVAWNRKQKKKPRYVEDGWVLRLRDKVRARGREAFFVHAPIYGGLSLPISSARGKDPIVLLRFNDPERFPDLYLLSSRGSTSHIKVAARPIYSRILANELLARWKRP